MHTLEIIPNFKKRYHQRRKHKTPVDCHHYLKGLLIDRFIHLLRNSQTVFVSVLSHDQVHKVLFLAAKKNT